MTTYDKALFEQEYSQQNEFQQNLLETEYIEKVRGKLQSPPFCYPTNTAVSVADGIVKHGDRLVTNAEAEDDEDPMDEINYMGDEFQSYTGSTTLELTIGGEEKAEEMATVFRTLYPLPAKNFNRTKHKEDQFRKALEHMKKYINGHAFLGFTSGIAILGETNEDGIVFGSATVPIEMVERAVEDILSKSEKRLPKKVDLVIVDGKDKLKISRIERDTSEVKKIIVQASN
jgi:hypothetical protein